MLHNGKGGGSEIQRSSIYTYVVKLPKICKCAPPRQTSNYFSDPAPHLPTNFYPPPPRIFSGFAHVIAGWDFHVKSWCVILTIWSWSNLETLLHIKTDLWDSSLRHNIATVLIFLNLLLAQFHIQDVKTFRWI